VVTATKHVGLISNILKFDLYMLPALKLTLNVLEKTLDGVLIPGLNGAIGGNTALWLLTTLQALHQNL